MRGEVRRFRQSWIPLMASLNLKGREVQLFLFKVMLMIISSESTDHNEYLRHPSTTTICCLYKSFSSVSSSITGSNDDMSEKEAGTESFRDAEVSGTRGKIGTNSVCGMIGAGESERRKRWELSMNVSEANIPGTDLYSLSIRECVAESMVGRRFLTDRTSASNTEAAKQSAYKASSSLMGGISSITSVVTGFKSFNKLCREHGRGCLSSEPS